MKYARTTKDNLCDTCAQSYATCHAYEDIVEYGDGLDGNNVIACEHYLEEAQHD